MAVEVVGREIHKDGRLRREVRRVLELKRGGLAHDGDLLGDLAHEAADRRADVAGHGHGEMRDVVDVADQLGSRRLAVGAGHRDELVAEHAPAELELAHHRQPPRTRLGDHRGLRGDAGALDDAARALEQSDPRLAAVHLDARASQLAQSRRGAGVDPDHLGPLAAQRERRRDARAGEPHDEERPGPERPPGPQLMLWR